MSGARRAQRRAVQGIYYKHGCVRLAVAAAAAQLYPFPLPLSLLRRFSSRSLNREELGERLVAEGLVRPNGSFVESALLSRVRASSAAAAVGSAAMLTRN